MFNLTPKEIKELEQALDEMVIDYDGYPSIDFWDREYDAVPAVMGCKHEWRRDTFFSMRVYETCKKCGAKKEEL